MKNLCFFLISFCCGITAKGQSINATEEPLQVNPFYLIDTFYAITGNSIYDIDANGWNESDTIFPHLKFGITDGSTSENMISDTSGNYTIPVQVGAHTVMPTLENPSYFVVTPSSINVTFPTETSPYNQNFCITANGIHNDAEVNIVPITSAIPGLCATYKIIYKNKGNQPLSGTVSFAFNASMLHFISASVTPSSQPMNYINWYFTNLKPFETKEILVYFTVNSPISTPPLNSGFVLTYTLSINSGTNEETPADNIFVLNQTVVNAHNPNEKLCLEGNTITPEMIGKEVHYIIRFENAGTVNFQNIVIKDEIDMTKFDISTLIPIAGSHPFITKISRTNNVEFIFENINLPFDAANNEGYVAFKIKTLSTLAIGDTFSNSASIYFDDNAPINTEPAVTAIHSVLANTDFEFSRYFTLSPNPAKIILNIDSKNNVQISSISIYNTLGQLVQTISNPSNTIDISNLKTGSYIVKVVSDQGTANSKFIKA